MISATLIVLTLHALMICTGLALIQFTSPKKNINLLENLPFSWGIGVVLIYLMGAFFVRLEIYVTSWHLIVLALMSTITAFGGWKFLSLSKGQLQTKCIKRSTKPSARNIKWHEIVILFLIAIKILLITYIAFINPVIDADAFFPYGYVAVGKSLALGLPLSKILELNLGRLYSALGPSLLTAWPSLFLSRWHICFSALPWLITYVSLIALAGLTSFRITRNRTSALVCTYLFACIHLLVSQTIRPGYHDALVAFFFVMAISLFTKKHLGKDKFNAMDYLLIATSLLGLGLSKIGGKLLLIVWLVLWLNLYLNQVRLVAFRKILSIETVLSLILLLCMVLFQDSVMNWIQPYDTHQSLQGLFPVALDADSFKQFFNHLFKWSSFGLFWWVFVGLTVLSFVEKKQINHRILLLYGLLFFGCVFYVTNFTNHSFVQSATTTGRFYLQIIGILIPVYSIFFEKSSSASD